MLIRPVDLVQQNVQKRSKDTGVHTLESLTAEREVLAAELAGLNKLIEEEEAIGQG